MTTITEAVESVMEKAKRAAENNRDYLTMHEIMSSFDRPDLGSDKVVIFFNKKDLNPEYINAYIENDIRAVEEVYNG